MAVQGTGVVRTLDLLEDEDSPCLVLELLTGESLASWARSEPRPLEAILRVGIQLAEALHRVHSKRWIHRDLSPANVFVSPETLETTLTDFGSARMLGSMHREALSRSRSRSHGFGAGLAYSSPEQTGRMGRGVDSRSDLYSLGACLYFVLVRRPPFDFEDPLALLHAHLAREPEPPHALDESVPVGVSRIVMKLLEKEPECRYQSARALAEDLQACLEAFERDGAIPADLPLATLDLPMRPMFRQVVYGREAELAVLEDSLEQARTTGLSGLCLVHAAPGMGKSALIDALRAAVAQVGGVLTSGRFDSLRRDVAHVGLRTALSSLADQMLCAGEEQAAEWQTRLSESLGRVAGVIAEFVPELGHVIGDVSPVAPLSARESARRLELALERSLRACSSRERPLVLALDDLQGANRDSVALLENLIVSTRDCAILWILGYRSEEPEFAVQVRDHVIAADATAAVCEIQLGPLPHEAMARMLADALRVERSRVDPLARAAMRKTDASPLMAQQFVLQLHAEGTLRVNPGVGWEWDDAEVAAAEVQEGAVAIICRKLDRMPERTREFCSLLSCIGQSFHAEQVRQVTGASQQEVESQLFELADEGLIAPSSEGFQFAHERIREACLEQIQEHERGMLHHRIGQQLLRSTSFDELAERCVEISMHLQLGSEHVAQEERAATLAIHLAAGERTLRAGAPQTACAHLDAGRRLLREADWDSEPKRAFSLIHESIEAEIMCGELGRASELAEELVARPLTGFDLCRALAKRIRVLTALNHPDIASEVVAALRCFGLRWSAEPSPFWIALRTRWVGWMLRGPLDGTRFRKPEHFDLERIFPQLILHEASAVLISQDSSLINRSILNTLDQMRQHGVMRSAALPLAGYAALRLEVLGDWKGLRRWVEASLSWADEVEDELGLIAKVSLYSFTAIWLGPRRERIEPLWSLMDVLQERGNLQIASVALISVLAISALVGRPLSEILAALDQGHRWQAWPKVRAFLRCHGEAYRLLSDPEGGKVDLAERTRELQADLSETHLHGRIHWLLALCLFEQFVLAEPMLTDASLVHPIRGSIALPEFHLLRGLAASERVGQTRGREAHRALRALRSDAAWLRARAQHAPDCRPLAAFLEAEVARSSLSPGKAVSLYANAARLAGEARFVHMEAWIHERSAVALQRARRQPEAISALRKAAEQYERWGAQAKVVQLKRRIRESSSR